MRTIIVGFDSFDPGVFEGLHQAGRMPNLSKFVEQGGYSPLEEVSPPQTEVSWTSIATGVDPGSHGIFDFVHRDPQTYIPYVSLLPTKHTVVGEQFLPPYTTKTLFHEAAEMGFPATALWWPALFPARPDVPVSTIPGTRHAGYPRSDRSRHLPHNRASRAEEDAGHQTRFHRQGTDSPAPWKARRSRPKRACVPRRFRSLWRSSTPPQPGSSWATRSSSFGSGSGARSLRSNSRLALPSRCMP